MQRGSFLKAESRIDGLSKAGAVFKAELGIGWIAKLDEQFSTLNNAHFH